MAGLEQLDLVPAELVRFLHAGNVLALLASGSGSCRELLENIKSNAARNKLYFRFPTGQVGH